MLHRLRELGLAGAGLRGRRAASAARGTGTATRARAATSRAWSTRTSSTTSSSRSGSGPSATRRSPRSCATSNHVADRFDLRRDIQFDTRVDGGDLRRGRRPLDGHAPTTATTRRRQFLIMATGCLSSANMPDIPGRRRLRRADVPHRPLAARGRRLHRQARRRHRHRLVGHPVDPADRRAGRRARRLPAHAELLGPGAQRARSIPTRQQAIKADYAELRAAQPADAASASARASGAPSVGARGRRTSERRARVRGALGAGRARASSARSPTSLLDRDANDTAAEFVRAKIREIVRRPRASPSCCRRRSVIGCKRLCLDTGYYETFNRPNVHARRRQRRRRSRRSRRPACAPAAASTSSTASCSPPASTP